MKLELSEKEVGSLKNTIDSILTAIYRIDRGYWEGSRNCYLVERIDIDDNELDALVNIARQTFTNEELEFLCGRVDEDLTCYVA